MRIAGKDLPKDKRLEIALTFIYGIGPSLAREIIQSVQVDPGKKIKELTPDEEKKIRHYIEKNLKIEADLKLEIERNLRRLKDIRCYRGMRHLRGLPVRGQKTRKNARTRKGKKITVGSGRNKPPAPK
ncbi:30S ribosomal protein S13 [bacterium]|nr:30S ribosomal protein S13 [bacterium]